MQEISVRGELVEPLTDAKSTLRQAQGERMRRKDQSGGTCFFVSLIRIK